MAIAGASALHTSAMAQQPIIPPAPDAIVVSGNGETRVDPDLAVVRLGVQGDAKTAQDVQSQLNTIAQKVLDAVRKQGIGDKDIQSGRITLLPIYAPQKAGDTKMPSVISYQAANTLTIRVEDLRKVGPVIDAAIGAGANEVQGISFELKNDLPYRQKSLAIAVSEAKAKAETIAQALGVKLGAIIEVNEGGDVQPLAYARMSAMANAPATPVSPGQVSVNASVTIRFRIVQSFN